MGDYGHVREQHLAEVVRLRREVFDIPTDQTLWLEIGRALTVRGEVVAILNLRQMGQFFGGRRVSCAFVGSVIVSPAHRGGGIGQELNLGALQELRQEGIALAVLYPTSAPFYRKV